MPRPQILYLYLCLYLTIAVGGCGDEVDDSDQVASVQLARAFDSTSELARLVVPLEASPELPTLSEARAQRAQVMDVIVRFRALVQNPLPCLRVQTDDVTFVDLTFDRCRIALVFKLDGSLRADVAIETSGGVPSAVLTSVTLSELTFTGPLHSYALSGQLALRHSLSPGAQAVQLDGTLTSVSDGDSQVAISASAEWSVEQTRGDGTCVTLSAGGELRADALGSLGPIALSGDAITTCRERCPTSGDVELSYGRGTLLTWRYDGGSSTQVVGARGRTVNVTLPCGGAGQS